VSRYVLALPFGLSQTNDQGSPGGVRGLYNHMAVIANITMMFLSMFDVSTNEMAALDATLFSP